MNKPEIKRFSFGDNVCVQNNEDLEEFIDDLVLVDAYWLQDGMKIRFIPFQRQEEKTISLIIVFVFKHEESKYNKEKAEFELTFRSDDTFFSQSKPLKIKGSDVKPLLDASGQSENHDKGIYKNHPCYYFVIDKFSSDLSETNIT